MIHALATLYVNVLEPAFKLAGILLALVVVLYLINLLRGGGKNDFLGNVVNGIIKLFIKIMQLIWISIVRMFRLLYKTISLIIATVSDFLKSPI